MTRPAHYKQQRGQWSWADPLQGCTVTLRPETTCNICLGFQNKARWQTTKREMKHYDSSALFNIVTRGWLTLGAELRLCVKITLSHVCCLTYLRNVALKQLLVLHHAAPPVPGVLQGNSAYDSPNLSTTIPKGFFQKWHQRGTYNI